MGFGSKKHFALLSEDQEGCGQNGHNGGIKTVVQKLTCWHHLLYVLYKRPVLQALSYSDINLEISQLVNVRVSQMIKML